MKKDSLVIDGKIFISSRRASEIAVYSKDYVGQLCREGKLVCRRVNRLWWVDENSIRKHASETLKSNSTSFKSVDKNLNTSRVVSDKSANAADVGLIQSSSVSRHRFSQSLDADPFLPINPSTKSTDAIIGAGLAAGIPMGMARNSVGADAASKNITEGEDDSRARRYPRKNSRRVSYAIFPRRIFAVGFALALCLVVGTAWMSVSIWKESNLNRSESSAEFSANALSSVWNGIFNEVASVLVQHSLPGQGTNSEIVALNNSSNNADNESAESAADLSEPRAGLVVVPSQGSSTDVKLAQTIANSFSDNVTVTPGSDGTTGVIKPEFRTVDGHDYLYVLVPVKTASTTTK